MNKVQLLAVANKYSILMAGAAEAKEWLAFAQYEKLFVKYQEAANAAAN